MSGSSPRYHVPNTVNHCFSPGPDICLTGFSGVFIQHLLKDVVSQLIYALTSVWGILCYLETPLVLGNCTIRKKNVFKMLKNQTNQLHMFLEGVRAWYKKSTDHENLWRNFFLPPFFRREFSVFLAVWQNSALLNTIYHIWSLKKSLFYQNIFIFMGIFFILKTPFYIQRSLF